MIEMKKFKEILSKYEKAFASLSNEIRYVHLSMVASMVIFMVPHML